MHTDRDDLPRFKAVIWATDGSENAARALPYAKALLDGEDGMLVAVHVVLEPATADVEQSATHHTGVLDAGAKVKQRISELPGEGVSALHKAVSYVGPEPAQGIAEIAEEVGADVIVIGTRGHSAIAGLVMGSVTQRLLHVAPCPVLAVPPIQPPAVEPAVDEPPGGAD